MAKKVLNEKRIRAISVPTGRTETCVYDALQDNLVLRVRVNSAGGYAYMFEFKYSYAGKRQKISLGAFPKLSIADARAVVQKHLDTLKAGVNPKAMPALESRKRILTFGQLYENWFESEVSGKIKEKNSKHRAQIFKDHVFDDKAIYNYPLVHIEPITISNIIEKVYKKGKDRTTAITIQSLKLLFSWAVFNRYMTHDPVYGFKQSKWVTSKRRRRYLDENELLLFLKGIRQARINPQYIHVFSLILAISSRATETVKIKKSNIFLDDRFLIIPAESQKETSSGNDDHKVFISDFAKKHIEALISISGDSEYLIPHVRYQRKKGVQPISSKTLMQQLARHDGVSSQSVSDLIKLPRGRFTVHDLRRTGSTWLAENNIQPHIITLLQNHKISDEIIAIYQASKLNELRREATYLLGDMLERIEQKALYELKMEPHRWRTPWARNGSSNESFEMVIVK